MHDAGPLVDVPVPTAQSRIPALGQNQLLLAFEAVIEPLVTVFSLWCLVWYFEGELTPLWLTASIIAFALAFPGRSLLRLPPRRVFMSIVLAWAWTAGLLLAMAFATGHIDNFSTQVVLHWLWFAPVSQYAAHWALRIAAPHLVRLQGPQLRQVEPPRRVLEDILEHPADAGRVGPEDRGHVGLAQVERLRDD